MYKKDGAAWLKHIDFVLLDLLCLALSVYIGLFFDGKKHGVTQIEGDVLWQYLFGILAIDFVIIVLFNGMKSVLKRGIWEELKYSARNSILLFSASALVIYGMKISDRYSRTFFFATAAAYVVSSLITRLLYKLWYKKVIIPKYGRSLLIISNAENLDKVMKNIDNHFFDGFRLAGLAVPSESMETALSKNFLAVIDLKNVVDWVRKNWVDEVMILMPHSDETAEIANDFATMGIAVHMCIEALQDHLPVGKQSLDKVGGFRVITVYWNSASLLSMIAKRILDILAGIVGCLITILIAIVFGPLIFISSPGHIFFSQKRVGKNGKYFKMYKFRSMVKNADELKAKYMEQNRVADGMMFKMDWDPRIIGNKELPDGTKKTGIGEFMRKTSLDEFPQFFNVLMGTMSLVGTRPPTLDEWKKYKNHHRGRLAMKPGITGMWQVSGRSNITDFEEIVRLDKEYIANWSFGLDLKILFKTVLVVLKHEGSM